MRLTAREIAHATVGSWMGGGEDRIFESLSTDTRTLRGGELFVALRGERFDAHDYLDTAIEAGVSGLVVSDSHPIGDRAERVPILLVPDTLRALGDIAAAWRTHCSAVRVAIVGSSGKTTTKEMLAGILRQDGHTHASSGNFNNLIGAPLSLLSLDPAHRWGVFELGMNAPGELDRLTRIVDPDALLVVNVGLAHIGQFDSAEALLQAKGESLRATRPGVPVVVSADCDRSLDMVGRWGGGHIIRTVSLEHSADVRVDAVEDLPAGGYGFDLHLPGKTLHIEIFVFGRFNIRNAAAAAAMADLLGVDAEAIVGGLASFRAGAMRSEVREVGGVTLLVDCYNANPDSMAAALESLHESPRCEGKTWIVLGDMLELGGQAEDLHRRLGRQVANVRPDGLFLIGDWARVTLEAWNGSGGAGEVFQSADDLARRLIARVHPGDRVFVKGSRGNKLEAVVEILERHLRDEKI